VAEFRATHLPRNAAQPAAWTDLPTRDPAVALRVPDWSPEELGMLGSLLAGRAESLRRRPVASIAESLAAAAAALVEEPRRRAEALRLLPAVTGYSPEMVELVLDRMSRDWTPAALASLLREPTSPAALDGWARGADGREYTLAGPRLALHVFSGNVTGVAVTALVRALLVKAPVLGKTAAGDPVLPVLFAGALAEVDAELADALAITYWAGGTEALERAALHHADLAVVYGGPDAVRGIQALAAAGTRVVEHGPRLSAAFVTRDALTGEAEAADVAAAIAEAASTFDQQGCVSPHMVFVESGGTIAPDALAGVVFERMVEWARKVPVAALNPGEQATLRGQREAAEFRELGGRASLFVDPDSPVTVVADHIEQAGPSCLNRFLRIHAVDDIQSGIAALAHVRDLLQTAGLATGEGAADDIASRLAAAGFTRICPIRAMPWPPPDWHHDGRHPLLELVRRVDREAGGA